MQDGAHSLRKLGAAINRSGMAWFRADSDEIRAVCEMCQVAMPGEAYLLGRIAALGPIPNSVATAALGLIPGSAIDGILDSSRSNVPRIEFAVHYRDAAADFAERIWGHVPDLEHVAAPLEAAMQRSDVIARPIPAALSALGTPDCGAAGRIMFATNFLREHRFAGHLMALESVGLSGPRALVLTSAWKGAPPTTSLLLAFWRMPLEPVLDELEQEGLMSNGAVTAAGRSMRDEVEAITDRFAVSSWRGVDDAHLRSLIMSLTALAERHENPSDP